MTRRILTGNQAVAAAALTAGVRVVTGYPGTPSTGCLEALLPMDLPDRHVEWSTNEKVAFEIATGAAWAGHRALCTMKMTGVNVAFDALISVAYSGTRGGLVVYVADDPGVSAGMAEQDTRGFARIAHLPMLEPSTPREAYAFARAAFELSEAVGAPVFVRLTTAIALGHAFVDVDEPTAPRAIEPILEKDIARYTKAGAAICRAQHEASIERLAAARTWIREAGFHRLEGGATARRLGVVVCGAVGTYLDEVLDAARTDDDLDADPAVLRTAAVVPFPTEEASQLLDGCDTLLVLEELEPYAEQELYVLAQQRRWNGRIVGKLDGTLPRSGEYSVAEILRGMTACSPRILNRGDVAPAAPREPQSAAAAARPITVCAGCPHRGTYLAIDAAIRQAGYAKDEVMVTGDIGCTILGMNPPFELLWNEVSMGSSVGLAQGTVHAGGSTPVIATIGDSTLFHGGLPAFVNAVHHRVPLVVVVLDNGWTAMTGMQVNPGTDEAQQTGDRRIDPAAVLRGIGVDRCVTVDPYDLEATTEAIATSLRRSAGVSAVIARRECAVQARRHGAPTTHISVDPERCTRCGRCLRATGCPALSMTAAGGRSERSVAVDPALCNGCGLCVPFCPTGALRKEASE